MTGLHKALWIYRACIVLAVAFALLAIWVHPARGHEWYDPWCCSGKDCERIASESVRPVDGGYVVTVLPGQHPMVTKPHTFMVPADKTRTSLDGDYHICLFPTENDMRCFYVPPMGS